MAKPKPGIDRGVLDPKAHQGKFSHERFYPCEALAPFIEHIWTASWDLRGRPAHIQRTLPYPSVHMMFERQNSSIVGVMTGAFTRVLEEQGRVFGVKFHPGAFFPWVREDAQRWTDRRVPLVRWCSVDVEALEHAIFSQPSSLAMAERIESFLLERAPAPDATSARLRVLVERARHDRSITKVVHLARLSKWSLRALQRIFARYVGVSPKWVIQRFRLQEASNAVLQPQVELAQLAAELGYADQAHFIRDFKRLIGATPAEYRARNQ